MAYTIVVNFESHVFADYREELSAYTFSISQGLALRNEIAKYAFEKLNMSATEPDFLLKQEYSRGAIEALTYLLGRSEESITLMQSIPNEARN